MKSLALVAPLAVLLLLSVTAAGCGSPPPVRYYTLRSEKLVEEVRAPQGAPSVLVDKFAIDDTYADERIAYREGATHELGFDPYARWAGPPASQVEDAVRDLLRETGAFSSVRQVQPVGVGRSGYDLIVTGRIARLEEVDVDEQWVASLDLELFLLDGKTREVVHAHRFAKATQTAKRNPRDVAATLGLLLEQAVKDFVAGAKDALAKK